MDIGKSRLKSAEKIGDEVVDGCGIKEISMFKIINLITSVSMFYIAGCAFAPDRTFLEEMDHQDEAFFVAGEDFKTVPGDEGRVGRTRKEIWSRTPKTRRQIERFREKEWLKSELDDLEQKQNEQQWRQYSRVKDQLGGLSEQIYFLKIPTVKERQMYLSSRSLGRTPSSSGVSRRSAYSQYTSGETVEAIRNRDILLGMSKNDVIKAWGRPDRIDVAGDPSYENERWAYLVRGERRVVYFESGRVEGWQ